MATLLLIDRSEAHRAQLRAAVEPACLFDEIVEAADGIQGRRVVLEKPVDVVLCRMELTGLDGTKLLSALQEQSQGVAAPLVFLTGRDDPERRARTLDAGASDVLTLPVHFGELVSKLRIHLRLKRLQDELRVENDSLGRLSTVDGLTGLRTRRFVDDVLSIEFQRARRSTAPSRAGATGWSWQSPPNAPRRAARARYAVSRRS